ncbi:triose-phosphate isomerase [Pseudohongiella spirulinae]|uniref:Triosephosphate isomerase n=1 Tax=Pseudohongiella spirulinae TaxID=1249552 RepID=A0A0S2KG57_9GAMM|nr:triose-phosphate isomerase [Pseudohongiella spirulinae]ALO47293.1 triosephosphate isomerase [Pseudohongiella spirulinae]
MRRALVAGNWKMNGSRSDIGELISSLVAELGDGVNGVDIVVCPPFPYLNQVADAAHGSELVLGAQNLSEYSSGAYTGEVSASMLQDFRVRYVIVGHSERRSLFAESNQQAASKFVAAREAGLTPILCVGETGEQRSAGQALQVVADQIDFVVGVAGIAAMAEAVIAYEPVWAIGSGESATSQQAQEMHAHIRGLLAAHDEDVAAAVQILYGGSVSAANAEELFACPDIDGGLVGGASLDAQSFIRICKSVS